MSLRLREQKLLKGTKTKSWSNDRDLFLTVQGEQTAPAVPAQVRRVSGRAETLGCDTRLPGGCRSERGATPRPWSHAL